MTNISDMAKLQAFANTVYLVSRYAPMWVAIGQIEGRLCLLGPKFYGEDDSSGGYH
jgi:hypothetical protein